jgi:hypothetical protein
MQIGRNWAGMISSTEMTVILTMIPYTLMIVIGIHVYEAKLKRIKNDLDILETDFFDLYNEYCNKSSNAQHYTQLQLDNASLKKSLSELDRDNNILQNQLNKAKVELLESRRPEYESSRYQSNTKPYNNDGDGFLIEL